MAAVGVSDRARSPSAGQWSVANVLSHLARTEGQVAALLQRRANVVPAVERAALPADGEVSIVASFDGAVVLDRRERVQAPEFAQPDLVQSPDAALRGLKRARARLEQVVFMADGKDLRPVRQAHFLFGELDFYQWVAFVGFHERRHTAQLREIAAALATSR